MTDVAPTPHVSAVSIEADRAIYRMPLQIDGARHRFHHDRHGWRATISRPNASGSATISCRRGPPHQVAEGLRGFVGVIDRAWDERFTLERRALADSWRQWRHGRPGMRAGSPGMRAIFVRRLASLATWSREAAFARRAMTVSLERMTETTIEVREPSWIAEALSAVDLAAWTERFAQGIQDSFPGT